MRIRAIDTSGDWTFGHGKQNYKQASDAIAQDVQTKLLEFVNDAFWNPSAGIEWINLMQSKNKQNQIALSCRAVMLKAEGVVRVNQVSVAYSAETRGLVISYNLTPSTARTWPKV